MFNNNFYFIIKRLAEIEHKLYLNSKIIYRDVAQFGSAPVLGTGGRRFESCHPDHHHIFTSLVQLAERRFPKPDVVGSSPTGRVMLFY